MNRREFIYGAVLFVLFPQARAKKVMLQATVNPIRSNVILTFTLANRSAVALTDEQGIARVTFRCRNAQASVAGVVEGFMVSDSVTVSCQT